MMARYRYDKETGELYEVTGDGPPRHGLTVIPDIAPYRSMVTGETISGRRQHREHLRQHNLVEVGNERVPVRRSELPPVREDLAAVFRNRGNP